MVSTNRNPLLQLFPDFLPILSKAIAVIASPQLDECKVQQGCIFRNTHVMRLVKRHNALACRVMLLQYRASLCDCPYPFHLIFSLQQPLSDTRTMRLHRVLAGTLLCSLERRPEALY